MKFRLLSLCIATVLMLSFALTVSAQATLKTTFTATSNIRGGPGTEWRIVGAAYPGTTVLLDGQALNGSWVRGIDSQGFVGWIFTANLQVTAAEAVAALPSIWVDEPFTLSAPEQEGEIRRTASGGGGGAAAPVASGAPIRGFAYGGHVSGMNDNTFGWMRVAGMTWIKKQVRWEPGNDPGGVAGLIETAHGNGFRILLGIVGDGSRVNDGGYFEAYAEYVGGVAALGADAIEVWNEPNIDREWLAGNISPERYTELLRLSYNAIKSRNAGTIVVSGAPAPTGFFGGCTGVGCDDNLYLQRMASAGAVNYMDCIGIHYNEGIVPPNWTSGDPRGSSSHYTRYYPTMVNTYLNAFGGRRPLCFTELGYLSPEGYGPLPPGFDWAGNVTVAQQAAWLRQVVGMAASSGRVRLLIIWNVDFQNYGDDPMAGFAMIRPGNVCPACEALSR